MRNPVAFALAATLLAGSLAVPALADDAAEGARAAERTELSAERRLNAPLLKVGDADSDRAPRVGFDAPVMSGPFGSFN